MHYKTIKQNLSVMLKCHHQFAKLSLSHLARFEGNCCAFRTIHNVYHYEAPATLKALVLALQLTDLFNLCIVIRSDDELLTVHQAMMSISCAQDGWKRALAFYDGNVKVNELIQQLKHRAGAMEKAMNFISSL